MKAEQIAVVQREMANLVEAALIEAELTNEMFEIFLKNVGKSEFQAEVRFRLAEEIRKHSYRLIEDVKEEYVVDSSSKHLKVIRDATVKGMPLPIMPQSLYEALVTKYPELADREKYPPSGVKTDEDYKKWREARKYRQPYVHSWKSV